MLQFHYSSILLQHLLQLPNISQNSAAHLANGREGASLEAVFPHGAPGHEQVVGFAEVDAHLLGIHGTIQTVGWKKVIT